MSQQIERVSFSMPAKEYRDWLALMEMTGSNCQSKLFRKLVSEALTRESNLIVEVSTPPAGSLGYDPRVFLD